MLWHYVNNHTRYRVLKPVAIKAHETHKDARLQERGDGNKYKGYKNQELVTLAVQHDLATRYNGIGFTDVVPAFHTTAFWRFYFNVMEAVTGKTRDELTDFRARSPSLYVRVIRNEPKERDGETFEMPLKNREEAGDPTEQDLQAPEYLKTVGWRMLLWYYLKNYTCYPVPQKVKLGNVTLPSRGTDSKYDNYVNQELETLAMQHYHATHYGIWFTDIIPAFHTTEFWEFYFEVMQLAGKSKDCLLDPSRSQSLVQRVHDNEPLRDGEEFVMPWTGEEHTLEELARVEDTYDDFANDPNLDESATDSELDKLAKDQDIQSALMDASMKEEIFDRWLSYHLGC